MTEAAATAADPHAETLATLARAFGEGAFATSPVPRQPPALRRRRIG